MSKLIIANWKSNKTLTTALEWCRDFSPKISENTEVIVAPSYDLLPIIREQLPAGVQLGAQSVSPMPMGSYTGAVNAQQLKAHGVSHVIVGHSERRRYFHETHQDVAEQLEQVISNAMIPVLCIDEEYIEEQANALESKNVPNLIVAYEPLAAIGSGNEASVGDVERVAEKIKRFFGEVKIIYGGSVDQESVGEFLLVCDGVLVGTASLDPQQFTELVEASV